MYKTIPSLIPRTLRRQLVLPPARYDPVEVPERRGQQLAVPPAPGNPVGGGGRGSGPQPVEPGGGGGRGRCGGGAALATPVAGLYGEKLQLGLI